MAIVSQHEACLFVDGRYHVSAGKEIDQNWTLYKVGLDGVPTWTAYLEVSSLFWCTDRVHWNNILNSDSVCRHCHKARELVLMPPCSASQKCVLCAKA